MKNIDGVCPFCLTPRLPGEDCDCDQAVINQQLVALRNLRRQSLNGLGVTIYGINKANGWNVAVPADWESSHKIPALLALIHSEASEALEAFRHNDFDNFTEELADVIIRVLDLTNGLEIDIEKAVLKKMEKNRGRGYRHGGKRV